MNINKVNKLELNFGTNILSHYVFCLSMCNVIGFESASFLARRSVKVLHELTYNQGISKVHPIYWSCEQWNT